MTAPLARPWSVRVGTWLACAVTAELLLLRMGTRTAVHIPGIEAIAGPYTVVATAARIAFAAAIVLCIAMLGAVLRDVWSTGRDGRVAAVGVGVFVAGSVAAVLGAPVLVADVGTVVALVCVAPFAVGRRPRQQAWFWWGVLLVVLVGAVPALTEAAAAAGLGTIRSAWVAGPVELAAVVVAIASPVLTGASTSRRAGIAAVGTAIVVGGAFAFGPSTTEILVLWNFGLSGFLPAAVYGVAAGCLAHTLVRLTETGRGVESLGLFLVVAGGVGLASTYQSAITLCGLAVAGLAVHSPETRSALPPIDHANHTPPLVDVQAGSTSAF